jgi:hypothetical protein
LSQAQTAAKMRPCRSDSALYEHDLMGWLDERAIGYAISADMSPQLSHLANYVASPWSEGVAWNYANPNPTVYWMGATPDVGTIENLTMVDNTNQPISSVTIEGPNFLWFENSGSSCGANQQHC